MAQLTKENIKVLRDAEKEGLISVGIVDALYSKSMKGLISLRDILFIISLKKAIGGKPPVKAFKRPIYKK